MNLLQVCTIVGDLARFENTLFFPKKKKMIAAHIKANSGISGSDCLIYFFWR